MQINVKYVPTAKVLSKVESHIIIKYIKYLSHFIKKILTIESILLDIQYFLAY